MNKLIRFLQNYLIIGLPLVVTYITLTNIGLGKFMHDVLTHYKFIWSLMGFGMIFWFVLLILFLISLVLIPSAREKTLKRLANLQERDEREQYITGKASRTAYISTLSLMILFLFFSVFTLSIYKNPPEKSANGRYTLSMGVHYTMLSKSDVHSRSEGTALFDTTDIFPSTSTVILILLIWQLLAFNLAARREQRG